MLSDQHIRLKLQDKTVGIAGCGGLGSNCAVALARVGVGKLIIVDFDIVEASNLNRQYFFRKHVGQKKALALKDVIATIDEGVVVEANNVFLTSENIPEIFQGCDVIVEAFDKADMKQMIIETVIAAMPSKPLICGVGLAGWGSNESISRQKYDNVYLYGDFTNEVSEDYPPLAPRVGVVANMQANLVLEILLGKMK